MSEFVHPLRSLLLPFTPLYRLGLNLRERRLASGSEPIRRLPFPIVSIGNLSTGGAGKTPLTISLAQALTARGLTVNVLSRGYGRTSSEPARVNPDGSAYDYGDEPLLIAREAAVPVYVAPQRYLAGLLAHAQSAPTQAGQSQSLTQPINSAPTIGLLDDGFQHRQLHRDIDILLLTRDDFHDRLLPAGNLREDLAAATRAHVLAIPADDPAFEAQLLPWLAARNWAGQLWRIHRRMEIPHLVSPAFAFCGIARPAQFFHGLQAAGLALTGCVALRDHHAYTDGDLRRLDEEARETGALSIVTTQKDLVRLPKFHWSMRLSVATLRSEITGEAAAIEWVTQRLAALHP